MKINEVLKNLSVHLELTESELKSIISEILKKPSYQEELLELIGYENMEYAEVICNSKKYFEVKKEKHFYNSEYTEHIIPALESISVDEKELVSIQEVENGDKYFNYSKFNAVQSKVFNAAYKSDENMLVCAPTGAGKTDVAKLTVLKTLKQKDKKVVYIVPMIALATEITQKYRKQLTEFKVIEYTGDTEIKSDEVKKADIIICTPEKFDAATRKQYNPFTNQVGLVIIDEIHLLQDDRGPVIETIVSRIFRQIVLKQKIIRIVGLSATLPNYRDVAKLLQAKCCFNFGPEYRPVPLKISVIGIFKKKKDVEDNLVKLKVENYISKRKQVLVFVHSRNETMNVAKKLVNESFTKNIKVNIPKGQLLHIVQHGVGIHHAGLPRNIRQTMENLFKTGVIDVLVTTATLAWGVNLPAHAVIIKGTNVYNSDLGKFGDLGILDVLQIFGRAGRPQYDTSGEACLITSSNKTDHYLNLIRNSNDVESKLLKHVADIINAEIYLNTIDSISTALSWLKGTFMYIRMLKNPMAYGLAREELFYEEQALTDYIRLTCTYLEECKMIEIYRPDVSNYNTWRFNSTEYGRIGSIYYLSHSTINKWHKEISDTLTEKGIFELLLDSKEFEEIRDKDEDDIVVKQLSEEMHIDYELSTLSKLYILVIAHIRSHYIKKYSLVCDQTYIIKNLKRLIAAFIEITINYKMYKTARKSCEILKKIEKAKKVEFKGEVNVQLLKTKNMIKIGLEVENNCGYYLFVYSNDNCIHAALFNKKYNGYIKSDGTTLYIEIVGREVWYEWIKEYYVLVDSTNELIYNDGVHECEVSWSLVGPKKSCIHYTILDSLYDLCLLDQSGLIENDKCLLITNRKVDISNLDLNIPFNLYYKKNSILKEGINITKFYPGLKSARVNYLLQDFLLDISFIEISKGSYRERLQTINSSILNIIGHKTPAIIISADETDMNFTYQELNTRITLKNIESNEQNMVVESGDIHSDTNNIFVTTMNKFKSNSYSNIIIFKGCLNHNGYYPMYEILKICDRRRVLIYEDNVFIDYMKECILDTKYN